ncbi:MAG: hypothetical protein ABEH43_06230, partial [Flavobacteriales bacterium]
CHMKGEAYVGNYLVTEAEMMAQIIRDKAKETTKNNSDRSSLSIQKEKDQVNK